MTDFQIVSNAGKFLPLAEDQYATLSDGERAAYEEVEASFAALGAAEELVAIEKAQLTKDVETAAEIERNAPRYDASAAHTALVKEMIASKRAALGF